MFGREIFHEATPEGEATFIADFDEGLWTIIFPFAGQRLTVSLPLSPDEWSDRDRRNWQVVRERLPKDFSLIAQLRRAILATVLLEK